MFKTLFVCCITCSIVSLLGQSQFCNNASQCVGTEWILSNYIYGYGYKSLYGPSTSITANSVACSGAFSCAQISFIKNTEHFVYCSGSHSCALSHINGTYVDCYGSNSCQNSNIIASEKVDCYGSQSCVYANISSPRVNAYGAYSLYASVIDSSSHGFIAVIFSTYQSGFGATIICRAGNDCLISCFNNGCEMLYLECEQNSNCNILNNNNDPSITIPPITNMNEYDYTLYDIKYDTNILNVLTNNELCENSLNFVYDNFYEHSGIIEINEENTGPVCCRGCRSCQNTESVAFTDILSDIVVCSGENSCENTIINTPKSVFCEGFSSCYNTSINKANDVYCLGVFGCWESVIRESTNVYCLGAYSCKNIAIQSNGNNISVYLLGFGSGNLANIYCDIGDICHIHCGGFQSCVSDTVLHCNNNCFVFCNTDTSCPNGTYTILAPTLRPTRNPTLSPSAKGNADQSIGPMSKVIPINIGYLFISMYFLYVF